MKKPHNNILIFFLIFPISLVTFTQEVRALSRLGNKVQNELAANPFLKKAKIKLEVMEEENGYVTIKMLEGNRKIREGINKGLDIFTPQFEMKWAWDGASKHARNSLTSLRRALNYIKENIKGVKEIMLEAEVNTIQDRADDLNDEAVKLSRSKKYGEANKLYRQAAEMGNPYAQYNLGRHYLSGIGVEQSYKKSIFWFQKAAEQDHLHAKNNLAWLFATCNDPQYHDGKKAVEYALAATSQEPNKWYYNGTLAAAYARDGRFEKAVIAQKKAIELIKNEKSLPTDKKEKYLSKANLRLKLYTEGKAFSERDLANVKIRIGINSPLTGDIPKVGEGIKFAAEMWLSDINAGGGLKVGNNKYEVDLVIKDNKSNATTAMRCNEELIREEGVLVIVGPMSSMQAVPAGGRANELKTPMISPWSTNPDTTKGRPFVFRCAFLDPLQGSAMANFIKDEFGFTKGAILYDVANDYSKGIAEFFKAAWEQNNGPSSVVAFESFKTRDTNFNSQLAKIISSDAQVLFTPQNYNEVASIVKQAHQLGWDKPIFGSDSWGTTATIELCGKDCYGLFFSTHYVASGITGAAKKFADRYKQKYGYTPDDTGALTWDSMQIVQKAIQDCGKITGNKAVDRRCVRDAMANIKNFEGITGKLDFTDDGDPIKCAAIAKISNSGEFKFYKFACP